MKNSIIIIAVVILVAAGAFFYFRKKKKDEAEEPASTTATTATTPTTTATGGTVNAPKPGKTSTSIWNTIKEKTGLDKTLSNIGKPNASGGSGSGGGGFWETVTGFKPGTYTGAITSSFEGPQLKIANSGMDSPGNFETANYDLDQDGTGNTILKVVR